MFQINSYLQFRNTPVGKPRVLRKGTDYTFKNQYCLFSDEDQDLTYVTMAFNKSFYKVANLSDCRPLYTKLLGTNNSIENVTDLDIYRFGDYFESHDDIMIHNCLYTDNRKEDWYIDEIYGSFFDDPAKYSKLLWNCSETEGWQKVFKLLKIEL